MQEVERRSRRGKGQTNEKVVSLGGGESHILPGGSRQDTTLAVPVPRVEGEGKEGVEQSHTLPGGSRQDTTLAVPVSSMIEIAKSLVENLKARWTMTNPGLEEVLDKVEGWADA
jgi:hypothetical protein